MGKYQSYITLGLLIVALIGSCWFLIAVSKDRVRNLSGEIESFLAKQRFRFDRLNSIPILEKQYNKAIQNRDALMVIVPEGQVVHLIEGLEKDAQEKGCIISIEVKQESAKQLKQSDSGNKGVLPKTPEGAHPLTFVLGLSGSYEQIMSFLFVLERMKYMSFIEHITLQEGQEEREVVGFPSEATLEEGGKEEGQLTVPGYLEASIIVTFYIEEENEI